MINEDTEWRQITQAKRCIHTTCECSDRYIALIIADSGISIHAAREGGDSVSPAQMQLINISIHAAREGGDDAGFMRTQLEPLFQSTPPVKAATAQTESSLWILLISIHAAREGGDLPVRVGAICRAISIHAAREGGDTFAVATPSCLSLFQSTPPVKAATRIKRSFMVNKKFQSTPPVKAATFVHIPKYVLRIFQSTPPVKAATR